MSYSWEGRCYQQKYGNQELTNICLSLTFPETKYASHVDTIQNIIGSKILAVEKDYDEVWEYHHITLTVQR